MREWRYGTLRKVLDSGLTVQQSHHEHWVHLMDTEGQPTVKNIKKVWNAQRNRQRRKAEKLGALLALTMSWEEKRQKAQNLQLCDYLPKQSIMGTPQDLRDRGQFFQTVMNYHDNFLWMLQEKKLTGDELRFLFEI